MAITGLLLLGFVIGHMVGNLQIFLKPEVINSYGAFLKSMGPLLWVVRLGLLACVGLHIWAAVSLALDNRAARPAGYAQYKPAGATYASRTMVWSGVIVLSFIIYHLLHFTVGMVNPEFLQWHDGEGRHDIYKMVISGFQHPLVSFFYILSMGLLCMHLSHGVSSLFQSLGLRTSLYKNWIDRFAQITAWSIFVGNSVIPLAILLGYGREVLN